MIALTTIDNPFNPIEQFDDWQRFDFDHDYHTNEILARFAKTSIELSDADYEEEIRNACHEIIGIFGDFYKIVES